MSTLQFFKDIVEDEAMKPLLSNVAEIVCYGIGSLASSKKCQEQLSLIVALRHHFKIDSPMYIFDPVMSENDVKLVAQLGFTMITNNEEAKRKVAMKDGPASEAGRGITIFYMPFCSRKLYDNLLWANWSLDALQRCFIMGNSFNRYNEFHLPPQESYRPYSYTSKAYGHYQEQMFPTNYPTNLYTFHELSFHWFTPSHLQSLDSNYWLSCPEPPSITDDPEVVSASSQTQ
ncbi:hypothetical protein SAMD00019534_074500 [Acytostelium subglobosum LB1]|uniref:hypothetical protein n=1 Tax=Acytostelium subglobosum LB1 TaxID=1410327 RepID=UPI0006449914|nr:hypothetical protein SAMD00019534_074500 [Acytostelium subglobosum LB1]GAM24275.1 hypothetical protein SAMD00019534_074500 [Acytostelium subglobosum LB1]|eukprot:XP_012752601.1 hypothetical protein SAMD00019534_074500 [Acytostelium subglobosum LB1]